MIVFIRDDDYDENDDYDESDDENDVHDGDCDVELMLPFYLVIYTLKKKIFYIFYNLYK